MKVVFKHEKQVDPQAEDGFKVNYARAKRVAFKARWNFLLLLIISPLLLFIGYYFSQEVLINADGILTSEPITIYAREDGVIDRIYYSAGEKVTEGKELFSVSSPVIDAEVRYLTEKLNFYRFKQSISLDKLSQLYQKKVELYDRAVKENGLLIGEFQKNNYKDYVNLTDRINFQIAKIKVDDEQLESEIGYELALEQHDSGSAAKIILDLELNLMMAKAKQKLLNIKLKNEATINEIFVHEGDYVNKGDLLISLSNRIQPVVHVYLEPKYLKYAKVGSTVTVKFPDGEKYLGSIKVPVKIADKIPSILSGPFSSNKAAIKMQIDFDESISDYIEGIPVHIRFHFQSIF
jgi:multidrug resistance efflux pump